jgi:glycosyltransferase involved in cell wall biosynthesis
MFDFLVIIPTFRRPVALRMAIETALAQTETTKQIIIADDCPEGSAVSVAQEFADVLYLKNPIPSGGWPGRVRNFAFDQSREMGLAARYVHFLDDDDTVPVGHYSAVKKVFEEHPTIGVVFGILRPFCLFSADAARRQRQEAQLEAVRSWRVTAARFPWLYQHVGDRLRLPIVTQWLYQQRATFGPEMFLCSGGVIRHEHVVALGGFPDIRITQDHWFYTDAIRKYGAHFLRQESAGYGVGDSGAIWNPLDLDQDAKVAHMNEWVQELLRRKQKNKRELGYLKYYAGKVIFYGQNLLLERAVIPLLERRNYFAEMYRLTGEIRKSSSDILLPLEPLIESPLDDSPLTP